MMVFSNNKIYKKIHRKLKKSQFFYFLKVQLYNKDYKLHKKKMKYSSKSKEQIKEEMGLIKEYWKCKPLHYIRYGLYEKQLSKEQLLDYIPPYYFYTIYCKKIFKPSTKFDIYNNKLKLFNYLKNKGIPTPDVIYTIENGHFKNNKNQEVTLDEVLSQINDGEKFFLKPIYGSGGTGIIAILKKDNKLYANGKLCLSKDIENSLNKKTTYIIQKGIEQREDIAAINPTSVNTLRAITQWRNGKPQLSICVMRIGRNGKDVDNSHQGGISIQIDVNNGRFHDKATAEHDGRIYTSHPDTQFLFMDKYLNNWNEIKNNILSYAEKVKELKEIAWDIAITKDEVVVIELNLYYGISHLQCCCGGLRSVLHVFPSY